MMNLLTDKDWRYPDHQTDNVNTADLVLLNAYIASISISNVHKCNTASRSIIGQVRIKLFYIFSYLINVILPCI